MLILIFVRASAQLVYDITDDAYSWLDRMIADPVGRINRYSLAIMKSDKTIAWIRQASEKIKRGLPIDEETEQ